MEQKIILLKKKDNICLITINHPPANAWNLTAMEEFEAVLDDVENDEEIRVVIITGAGDKCFSAGFDVSDAANADKTSRMGQKLWQRVDCFAKPVIAAINGFALGGGLELALACHFRIMVDTEKAKVGLTEVNLGIIPGWGGTQRMARLIGRAQALDMILFSKKINAGYALDIGLINQISSPESLMDDALELAERLAKRPPLAVAAVLKAVSAGMYQGLDAGLAAEADAARDLAQTEDAREGVIAFMQKRPPVFKGK